MLTARGFIVQSDNEAGVITTNFIRLESDEMLTNDMVTANFYGSLRIILTADDTLTEVQLTGFWTYSGSSVFSGYEDRKDKDAIQMSNCYPLIQKYRQLISGEPQCPCRYYTGNCNALNLNQ
jgi:hypothetical protein